MAAATLLGACNQSQTEKHKGDILKTNLDTTVNPADDFFQYAEGRWLAANKIPPDQTSWGIGQLVQEELYERLRKINEDAEKKNAKSGADQQIGDFWHSGMDTVTIEKEGINPLKDELNRINSAQSPKDIMSVASHLHSMGVGVFFGDFISQDAKKSDEMAYYLYQGGLGLPNRDYYFNQDERTTRIRGAYPAYVAEMLGFLGYDTIQAKEKAQAIIAMESRLAKASRTLEALRDPYANYNKMAISELHKISPSIAWTKHLTEMGVKNIDSVIVGQPEFYRQLDEMVRSADMQTLKDYMSFHLLRSFAPYLNKAVVDASFNFYSRMIRGAEAQRPRWKRVLDAEEDAQKMK